MTLLIFVGQIATGIALDVFVHQQLALGKIAGGALILGGMLANLSIDEQRRRERARM
jgi:transporter family-2 protein